MYSPSFSLVVFTAAIVLAPFAVKWWMRQRQGQGAVSGAARDLRVVSTASVGPQQRVVTVEAGPSHARVWLVLGVTAGGISVLHTAPPEIAPPPHEGDVAAATLPGSFAKYLAQFRGGTP